MLVTNQRGFTLAELLIGLALVGLVLAAVTGIQRSVLEAYVMGSNRVEAQQNARASLERLARELRESRTGITAMTATSISFTDQAGVVITWALNGTNVQRNGVVIVGGAQTLNFTYWDGGNPPTPPQITAVPANVRRVDITLQTRSEEAPAAGIADTRALITTSARLRNGS